MTQNSQVNLEEATLALSLVVLAAKKKAITV